MTTLPLNFSKDLVAGNVKVAMKAAGASRTDTYMVDPRKVRFIEGFNVRTARPEYEAHIEHITQSIMANGFYSDKPIAGYVAVEDGEQVIYATEGHTRTVATLRAIERGSKIEEIPMVVKPRGTSMEDLTVALMTSNDGLPLTPYEIGVACKRLVDVGWDVKKISVKINRTVPYINDLLGLVGAPKVIRDLVISGQVSATLANKELKEHGPKAVVRLQEAMKTAVAAGKTKVTNKHVGKKPGATKATTLKLKGLVQVKHKVGSQGITIMLDGPLEVELLKGDKVRIVVIQGDDEL